MQSNHQYPSYYLSCDSSTQFANLVCRLNMATGGSFPHANLQFPAGVHNIQHLKAQFERNKYTLMVLEKIIEDLTREDKEGNKNSIAQLKAQLTAVRGAQLAIKIELDNIDDQA